MKESIGALLRRTRELRRLSIAQVSESTRVRSHYLQALESDDLSAMPSTAQARGFLRNYAEFLGLEIDELVPGIESQAPSPPRAGSAASESMQVVDSPANQPSLLTRLRGRASRKPGQGAGQDKTGTDESPALAGESPLMPDGDVAAPPGLVPPSSADSESEAAKPKGEIPPAEAPPEAAVSGSNSVWPASEADDPQTTVPGLPASQQDSANSAQDASDANDAHGAGTSNRLIWLSSLLSRLWHRTRQESPPVDHGDETSKSSLPEGSGSAQLPLTEAAALEPDSEESEVPAESSPEASNEIFAEIGQQLRQRREMLSLTHEEIERHTRVRASFLQALELGSLEELPSPVQTRGILANYAAFLDLDVDDILLRFADGLQARHREQKPQWQPARTRPTMTVHTSLPPLRSFIASDLLFGVGVAVVLLLFAVWGISRVMTVRTSGQAGATAPSISEVLAGTPAPALAQEVTLIPAQDTPLAPTADTSAGAEIATLDPGVAVQIHLVTSERTYMRVTVDGKVDFEGRTELGKDYTYQAARQIEVLVGNAAALRVALNGRDTGLMGSFGEVVDRIYTVQGVFTPTATPPPTPTATPNFTATPSITPTVTHSATPTPKTGG